MSELRGELSLDEEFDEILGNISDEALLDDPSEADLSAVRSPTDSNRQVLATLAVASEGSYVEIADRAGLVPEANARIITMCALGTELCNVKIGNRANSPNKVVRHAVYTCCYSQRVQHCLHILVRDSC